MTDQHSRIAVDDQLEAPALRTDAQQNRDRILEVARVLFAQRGLDVPMAAIARRAGVGVATLYRRFPTKEDLVTATFAERFEHCLIMFGEAKVDPDPWRAFCTVIEEVCAMQAGDRGFRAVLSATLAGTDYLDQARSHFVESFEVLVRRAKEAGRLRKDFAVEDLSLILQANGGIAAGTTDAGVAASRRLVAYLIDAFRADRSETPARLPPPVRLDLIEAVLNGS
ncbi:TetR/AcrR family transcriptional regulator [Microlunatus parietis]|uniref:AcrR family transcriptional regulator n=1 Tax=Microlunatus parietis TaxID=682979 RepID=A0A7Y9IC51_9ACTN|nr:TetR/AcrR family transcriptional regulator [Microlunatus parietis]NYE74154.1 AcrR family transcriptional regulator [Microlunatus parietis]